MDEIILDGKTYVGSKKAAHECGYAQDYVGQLARRGFIDAKRVSGQWYVQLDSLKSYKQKAETFKPEPPKYNPDPNVESSIEVEGKEYVSAARAAKLAEYNQDYIAQLARAGKIPSKQIGNRWYVEPGSLLQHKQEKDAMLRAVQAEAVGLKRPESQTTAYAISHTPKSETHLPIMTYEKEHKPLFPEIAESVALKAVPVERKEEVAAVGPISKVPIRVLRPITIEAREDIRIQASDERKPLPQVVIPGKAISRAVSWQIAAAAILLLTVGIGAYKKDAVFALATNALHGNQAAAAADTKDKLTHIINQVLTKELVYIRQ